VQQGEDPIAAKKKAAEALKYGETVTDLVRAWRERHALLKNRCRTIEAYDSIARRVILPAIGSALVRGIRTRDLAELLTAEASRLRAKGKRGTQANRTKAVLTKIFKLACQWGWIDADPTTSLSSPVNEKPRERFLDMNEIEEVWALLETEPAWFATSLRLLLVTGQRPGELLDAERADFDLEGSIWTVLQNKTGQPHIVPLPTLAQALILSMDDFQASPFFIVGRDGRGKVGRTSLAQATRRFCAKRGLTPFTPHDLRRTVTTHMRRLGISPHIVDRVQNRTEPSVQARHYDRWTYLPEKTEALSIWAMELEGFLRAGEKASNMSKKVRVPAL
jgi:integrase